MEFFTQNNKCHGQDFIGLSPTARKMERNLTTTCLVKLLISNSHFTMKCGRICLLVLSNTILSCVGRVAVVLKLCGESGSSPQVVWGEWQ